MVPVFPIQPSSPPLIHLFGMGKGIKPTGSALINELMNQTPLILSLPLYTSLYSGGVPTPPTIYLTVQGGSMFSKKTVGSNRKTMYDDGTDAIAISRPDRTHRKKRYPIRWGEGEIFFFFTRCKHRGLSDILRVMWSYDSICARL